jgi:hypothetical protein
VLVGPTHDLKFPNHWSRDGRFLLYTQQDAKTNTPDWATTGSTPLDSRLGNGSMLQSHVTTFKPTIETKEVMLTCEVLDKKCTTLDQFSGLIEPSLNN